MKVLLGTSLEKWAKDPLTTMHVLRSGDMLFIEVAVTKSVDDVGMPCPIATIPMLTPLVSAAVVATSESHPEQVSQPKLQPEAILTISLMKSILICRQCLGNHLTPG